MNPILAQSSVHPAVRPGPAMHLAEEDDGIERWPMPRTTIFVAVASLVLWFGIGYGIYRMF